MLKKIMIKKSTCALLIILFVMTSVCMIISNANTITTNPVTNMNTTQNANILKTQDTILQQASNNSNEIAAIDITNDLVIDIVQTSLKTRTQNGIYDTGSSGGTYLPGKDFSEDDDVSKGNSIDYTIGVSLSSKTNSKYDIDKMYIEVVNEIGDKISPFYFINTDPNSENLILDGKNTIVDGQTAIVSSITLGPNDSITSISTSTLNINFSIQNCYWKTRLMPKIRVVCEKNGQKQVSNELDLTPVKMSSKSQMVTTLNGDIFTWNKYNYQTINGVKGFLLPFQIVQNKQNYSNMMNLIDNPIYSQVEYPININAFIEGEQIPITTENISITNNNNVNYEVSSYEVQDGILKIKLLQKQQYFQGFPNLVVSVFLPYDVGDKKEVTVNMSSEFSDIINQTNFVNRSLFDVSQVGKLDRTVKISLEDSQPPITTLKMKEDLFAGIGYKSTQSNSIVVEDVDFINTIGSQFVLLLDSDVVSFGKNSSISIQQNNKSKILSDSEFTVSYANISYDPGYDPNIIGKNMIDGVIPTGTYEQITSGGKKANAMIFTLTANVLDSVDIKDFRITVYNEDLDQIPSEEFARIYQNNPDKDFTGYAYSYTSFNTDLTSLEEAYKEYGNLLALEDDFSLKNGSVRLNWGTTQEPLPETVSRFNNSSTIRKSMKIPVITQPFNFGIYNKDNNQVNIIEDYSKEYQLQFVRNQNDYSGTDVLIKNGTKITFTMNDDLDENFFIRSIPYLEVHDPSTNTFVKINIEDYSYENGQLVLTIPMDFIMTKESRIVVPANILVPNHEKTLSISINVSNDLYLVNPKSFLNGSANSTKYYKTDFQTFDTILLGAQADSSGLSVTPTKYPNGSDVKYSAKLLNKSFDSSDYYIGMTVPTNQYSAVETSDNNLKAYIKNVLVYDSNVELYYQTEDNVTLEDINVFKSINQSPTLNTYYNSVVKSNWIKYDNNSLPNNVVMMIAFANDVKKTESIQIDYDVNINVAKEDTNIYTNNNVLVYYSTGSTVETKSNQVSVQNIPSHGLITVKHLEKGTNRELSIGEILTGLFGTPYQTNSKEIDGYTLVEIPSNSTGQFQTTPQEVIYYYTKNSVVTYGTVVVKYLEKGTNTELANTETLTGQVATPYQTNSKEIVGYTLVEIPSNSTGDFQTTQQEVIYYYTKDSVECCNTHLWILIIILVILLIILLVVICILCILLNCCKKNKPNKPCKTDKPCKPDKPCKTCKCDKPDKSDKSCKCDKSDKPSC